jgi:putative transposase
MTDESFRGILILTMEALMKKRYTEEQIVALLKEADAGGKVEDICRRAGVCVATFFRWRSKYSGVGVPEIRRMRELEQENGRLKRIVVERDLEIDAMREVLKKNW